MDSGGDDGSYNYTSIMSDALDLFEVDRYLAGRYCEVPRGSDRSLADCLLGLTLADIAAFTREELMREVEREGGPHKQLLAWLREPQSGLPNSRACVGDFLLDASDAPASPPPQREASFVRASPRAPSESNAAVPGHRRSPSADGRTVLMGNRRSPSPTHRDSAPRSPSPTRALPVLPTTTPTVKAGGNRSPSPTRPLPVLPSERRSPTLTRSLPAVPVAAPVAPATPSPAAPAVVSPRNAASSGSIPKLGKKKLKEAQKSAAAAATDVLVHCVVLGGGAVGKSCLTIRWMQGHFVTDYDPTIEDAYRKGITLDMGDGHGERSLVLDVLDTAGQEELSAMRDQYMESGEGFVLVYDVTSRDSLSEIDTLANQLRHVKDSDTVPSVLVANKTDLVDERVITEAEGRAKAKLLGASYVEASALAGVGVQEAFAEVVRAIWFDRQRRAASSDGARGETTPRARCTVL